MRILITGGFGFIGSAFAQEAINSGHELIIVDKMTYAADPSNLSDEIKKNSAISNIDIADNFALSKFLDSQESFDRIVNFAAESHVDRSIKDGLPFVQSNIAGVVNLLEYLKKTPDTPLLQVSTDEVYGSIPEGSWDELQPLNPRSAYSSSKAAAEFFCNSYRNTHGLKVTITRCANNFGPRQSAEKLIPTIIKSIIDNKKIPLYGAGINRREWIYVNDHASALLKIISAESIQNPVYNLGGLELSNNELAANILGFFGKDASEIEYVQDRKGHDLRYSVDDSLFRAEFGPIETGDFMQRLKETVIWYANNMEWLTNSIRRVSL
jgi:dTDP-glucose 4,6-dehydratase